MGNEAAHEATPHPDEQLLLGLEIVEHLLKSVYIIPYKLKKFAKPKIAAKAPAVKASAKKALVPAAKAASNTAVGKVAAKKS